MVGFPCWEFKNTLSFQLLKGGSIFSEFWMQNRCSKIGELEHHIRPFVSLRNTWSVPCPFSHPHSFLALACLVLAHQQDHLHSDLYLSSFFYAAGANIIATTVRSRRSFLSLRSVEFHVKVHLTFQSHSIIRQFWTCDSTHVCKYPTSTAQPIFE